MVLNSVEGRVCKGKRKGRPVSRGGLGRRNSLGTFLEPEWDGEWKKTYLDDSFQTAIEAVDLYEDLFQRLEILHRVES